MKMKKVKELFKQSSLKIGGVVLATALVISSSILAPQNTVPELVTFVDTETTVEIAEDEVPLSSSTSVTTSSKTTKKTKKVKLKKASKKTYSKAGKTTTKTTTKKASTASATTTTQTTTKKSIVNNYTKGSKVNKRVTTTVTTVTKTVVAKAAASSTLASSSSSASAAASTTAATNGTVTVSSIASKADSRVSNAFNTLGFTIKVNSGVSYSGLFDARTRTITLKKADDTIYHELGHFVAFVAGNVDTSSEFKTIYSKEKSLYTAYDAAYVTSDSSEYFAESFREYTLNGAALKASRPLTYAYIQTALNKITSSQISLIQTVYSSVWK